LNGQLGDANIRHVFTEEEEENLFAKKAGCQKGLQPINAGYHEHLKSLYQPNTSNADLDFANKFETLLNTTAAGPTPFIDTATINDCISSLKYCKTPGHDCISNEQ